MHLLLKTFIIMYIYYYPKIFLQLKNTKMIEKEQSS